MTLAELLDELARRGLRVASVRMDGNAVASFMAVPADNVTAPARAASPTDEKDPEPDALETFVNRKGLK